MEDKKLYLLLQGGTPIGVFTDHRKAMQELFIRTIHQELTPINYTYDMNIEYFAYTDKTEDRYDYMIYELLPDVSIF